MTFVPGYRKTGDYGGITADPFKAPPPPPEKDYLGVIREMEETLWNVVVVFAKTEYVTRPSCRIKETADTLTLFEDDGTVTVIPKQSMQYYQKKRLPDAE